MFIFDVAKDVAKKIVKNKVLLNFFQKIMGYGVKPHKYNGEAEKKNAANFAEQKSGNFLVKSEKLWSFADGETD